MGRLSEALKSGYGVDALRDAAIACLLFYVLAAVLVLLAIPSLKAAWVDDPADETA